MISAGQTGRKTGRKTDRQTGQTKLDTLLSRAVVKECVLVLLSTCAASLTMWGSISGVLGRISQAIHVGGVFQVDA